MALIKTPAVFELLKTTCGAPAVTVNVKLLPCFIVSSETAFPFVTRLISHIPMTLLDDPNDISKMREAAPILNVNVPPAIPLANSRKVFVKLLFYETIKNRR